MAPRPTSKGNVPNEHLQPETVFQQHEMKGIMAPLPVPDNLHPFTSANGFKVWHQESIT